MASYSFRDKSPRDFDSTSGNNATQVRGSSWRVYSQALFYHGIEVGAGEEFFAVDGGEGRELAADLVLESPEGLVVVAEVV